MRAAAAIPVAELQAPAAVDRRVGVGVLGCGVRDGVGGDFLREGDGEAEGAQGEGES